MLNKLTTAAAIIALATTGVVNARSYDKVGFNLGGELSINRPSLNKSLNDANAKALRKTKPGANIFAGVRFNQYFGAEVGVGFVAKTKATVNGVNLTNKATNIYVDALGFVPVATKVDLVGAVGVGRLHNKGVWSAADIKQTGKTNKFGPRVSVGAQYHINDCVSARAMVRYQKASSKNFNKANTSLTIGAAYNF